MFNWKKVARSLLAFSLVVAMTLTGCGKEKSIQLGSISSDDFIDIINEALKENFPDSYENVMLKPTNFGVYSSACGVSVDTNPVVRSSQNRINKMNRFAVSAAANRMLGEKNTTESLFYITSFATFTLCGENYEEVKAQATELIQYIDTYVECALQHERYTYLLGFCVGGSRYRYSYHNNYFEFVIQYVAEDLPDFVSFKEYSKDTIVALNEYRASK